LGQSRTENTHEGKLLKKKTGGVDNTLSLEKKSGARRGKVNQDSSSRKKETTSTRQADEGRMKRKKEHFQFALASKEMQLL